MTENELAVSALRRIANIAHHGALLGYDEDSAVREIRRLSMPWWNKAEAEELQRRDAATPRPNYCSAAKNDIARPSNPAQKPRNRAE